MGVMERCPLKHETTAEIWGSSRDACLLSKWESIAVWPNQMVVDAGRCHGPNIKLRTGPQAVELPHMPVFCIWRRMSRNKLIFRKKPNCDRALLYFFCKNHNILTFFVLRIAPADTQDVLLKSVNAMTMFRPMTCNITKHCHNRLANALEINLFKVIDQFIAHF